MNPRFLRSLLPWLALTLLCSLAVAAEEIKPLEPIDTSSPRTTLRGFLEFMDEAYAKGDGLVNNYLASSRLYLSPDEVGTIAKARYDLFSAERALDLSQVPPAMLDEAGRRLTLQLKEVLDRIELPPWEAIPDAPAMAAAEFKRWTIPGTEIRLVRMETGPRAGEYLFGPETVQRIPDFYAKVKYLPYRSGARGGLYDFVYYRPTGVVLALRAIVPPRWILGVPGWAMASFLDQPVWRWIGIMGVFSFGFGLAVLSFRLSQRWVGRTGAAERWTELLRPLSLVLIIPVAVLVLTQMLRISGEVNAVLTLSLWSVFYLALTWLVWVAGGALAESLIESERLITSSIDSQLIRLVLRLVTLVLAVVILVVGGDRVGVPAYSVVAGLGVGGLAVALAAQQTLANLLGSLIIMFEKPFTIGHWIKVGDIEGVVESVGFRSTRIRTFYDSLVSIPSSELVNSTVDNMELRQYRQVKTTLGLTYDTTPAKLGAFVTGVELILRADPDTRKDNIQVAFNDFGASSLDILLNFLIRVSSRREELAVRQRILLEILQLAETSGIGFAFPTQTLHIESLPPGKLA
ncbi:MscS family membrane protein [Methylomagnum ishizawai]|uniref:MscS family membrane protein n=1 Tax=Methylomagnum ishizawai TaxID=1760988 RepID=A0A1Y6CS71_9GAMM|nr:mechanosensitive ion channel family protein [Methylomagnum ishizawai]SMF93479.1 MscS family membrane protein [Methylomagnum ishizawai]